METPEVPKSFSASLYKSMRINVLLAVAYMTVIMCLFVTVYHSEEISQYAQGIITLILGKFLAYTDQVYSFEFGTTRNSKTKDESIAALTSKEKP